MAFPKLGLTSTRTKSIESDGKVLIKDSEGALESRIKSKPSLTLRPEESLPTMTNSYWPVYRTNEMTIRIASWVGIRAALDRSKEDA